MTQQSENHTPNFFYEEDSSCRGIAVSLDLFHRNAIRRSETYRMMIRIVLAFSRVKVYVRKHLKDRSRRVIWSLDLRHDTHTTKIEISRSAIEARACMFPQTQHSKVIERLAISYLIHGVRRAIRVATQENPLRVPAHHQTEDDGLFIETDEFMLQDQDGADGEDVSRSSSADTISRICGEIGEHSILYD
ncbi:hypothetical protein FAGAP_13401 [Fusarium agapanthi]|uniref:Uncharacterized protein n=1 Tax=Fusarium agapanthi TaxID=1803897 RepID=A0A9P5B1W3_9HYPO|nr:hypothetical protein FAGAP_13401 [Fusarium agapanthi]